MTSDIDRRALDLVERENAEAELLQEQEAREAEGSRLDNARRRIKENDAEIERERRRRGAEAEAEKLARQRYELAGELEEAAANMNMKLAEYRALHEKHSDVLRRAGRPLGHGSGLQELITRWWRARFGGWNSITSTPSPHHNAEDRPLPDMDTLARPDAS